MKLRFLAASAAAAVVALAFTLATAGDPTPEDAWKQGNKFYEEKTYKKALENYLEVRRLAPDFAEKDDLNLRIAVCHLRLRQWDKAEDAFKVAAKGEDHYKMRALVLLGQLYRDWPHEVYVKGDERKRGEWFEGASYEWTQTADMDNALRCFEEAKKVGYELRDLYATALAANPKDRDAVEKKDRTVRQLTCDLNAELWPFVEGRMGRAPQGERWKDPEVGAKRYDPAWSGNEKVLFLMDEIVKLDPDDEKHARSAAAMRDKAMYVLRRSRHWEVKAGDDLLGEALAILRGAKKEWPASGIADQIQYMIARTLEDRAQWVQAVEEFQKVLDHKDSKWISDARWRIQEIQRPRLGLSGAGNYMPGQKIQLNVGWRNVKTVAFRLEEFDLEGAWTKYVEQRDGDFTAGDFASFAASRSPKKLAGAEVSAWELKTEDDGRHASKSQPVEVPAKKAGAYLLTAEADNVTSRVVVLVSDIVMVERTGREGLFYVADAASGAPVEGAQVRVLERISWWDNGKQRFQDNKFSETTDKDGLADVQFASGNRGGQVMAYAKKDGRLAVGVTSWHYWAEEGGRGTRVDTWTDRPVYRPGQAVNWKSTIRLPQATGYAAPEGQTVHVRITDPKGNALTDADFRTSEFGSVSGSVTPAAKAPLGVYSIQVEGPGGSRGWSQFRVEEYKKPEVKVDVVAKTELAKLGEGLTAEIRAEYYFGGGVPNADVHFTVIRRGFSFWYREPEEFDWYYGDRWGRPGRDWNEEVIVDGNGKTDENGVLLVEWSTMKAKNEMPNQDHEYEVRAQVTDASRRTVEGSGAVRVTRTQMFATLSTKRGFYTAGDHVEIELNTQNANNSPLPSEGSMTVARIVWDATIQPNGGWKDEPFFTEPAKTGNDGRGFWKWQADRGGYYAFIYEAKDGWGEKVTGRTQINVADPNAANAAARFRELDLSPEDRTYRPGQTARILLWSDVADAAVLVTTEANYTTLSREVVRLKGKSKVLEFKLGEAQCPNFHVRAVTVRNGEVHQAHTEIFVPPADKFLDVTVTPSKPEYKPGEHAKYEISATDWQGKPAKAEFGVAVFDKSVLYIAPSNVPDLRLTFWGGRRWANVNLLSSRQFSTSPATSDGNKYPEYKLHGDPPGYGGRWGGRRARGGGVGGGGGAWDKGAEAQGFAEPAESADHNEAEGGELESKALREEAAPGAPAPKPESLRKAKGDDAGDPGTTGTAAAPAAQPVVRKNFADTACWMPMVVTDANGKATVEFDMPDSLTTWRAVARGMDTATRVGGASSEVQTRKTLMARLQAPRFFRERDELLVSAIVNNAAKVDEQVKAELKLEGGTLELGSPATVDIRVAANGEVRLDWKVKATKEGMARIVVSAIGQQDSDAMQLDFPVYVHGMDKLQSWAGVVKGDSETATFTIDVPADRKVTTADLTVQISPTMMGAILDALPYLIEYPYGCVEQTMSRFMPAVAVAKTLKDTGINLEDVGRRRDLAYADIRTGKNPVFHTAALETIVEQGLNRLYGFQNGAGGWGWWQSDRIDPFITAYVVNGLRVAKAAGAPVDENRLQMGINALRNNLREEKDLHRAAYCAWVLAECGSLDRKDADHLYTRRGDMNSYGRALMAMALFQAKDKEKAEVCIRNMEDFVKVDEKTGMAWWDREDRWAWWYWYGDDVEGNSAILRAYVMVDPKNPNVPRLAKWLLANRDGVRWKSTRDTAHAMMALLEYAKVAGELSPEYTADVEVDGKLLKSFGVTADNVLTMNGEASVKGDALETGKHTITVRKSGKGTAYWSVYLKYFTTEEDLAAGSSKMSVTRTVYRLKSRIEQTNENGRPVKRTVYDREKLASGAKVTSGDLLEIEMEIDAPNDYEYLVFEDFKAAGVEPTEVVSGRVWGALDSNREFRDEKVAFFVDWMPRGKHKISYRARAEIPGSFHAMPVNGYAMYAPSVRAISDEFRLVIEDKPAEPGSK